MTRIDIALYM